MKGSIRAFTAAWVAVAACVISGCGGQSQPAAKPAQTTSRTQTTVQTTSSTQTAASPCPAGEFAPYGLQGGCYTTPHPSEETNPVSCPTGQFPADGGCAPDCEQNNSCESSTPSASDPCPPGYQQITEPFTACLAGGAKVVGSVADNSDGVVDGIGCPTDEHVVAGATITPATGPDYDPYTCQPGAPSTSGLTPGEQQQINQANQSAQECSANPNSAACLPSASPSYGSP